MKRRLSIFILVLAAAVGSASAQLLWKVTTPDGLHTSYIFGTHHVAPVSMLDSIAGFKEALANSAMVIGEMDMAAASSPAAQQVLAFAGMAPADSTITSVFTPAQVDSVKTVFARYFGETLPIEALNPFKPAMLSTMLAMAQAQTAFPDFDPSRQLDSWIQQQARAAGKEVQGFETVEQQAAILFGSPIAEQARELMEVIAHDNKALDYSRRLANLYMAGDLDGILAMMEDPETGFDAAQADRMLYSRNESWVKILAGMLPTATILAVVGAGHLAGTKGLLALLAKEGYNVTPMQ